MRSGLPPGRQLQAIVGDPGSRDARQLRILGDDRRGYLLAGTLAFSEAGVDEFWFATLDDALAAGEALGAPRDAWSDIERLDEVHGGP